MDEFVQAEKQEKLQAEKEFLLADISEVKNILAKIPEDVTIYRASLEYRLEEALKELEEMPDLRDAGIPAQGAGQQKNERLDQKV